MSLRESLQRRRTTRHTTLDVSKFRAAILGRLQTCQLVTLLPTTRRQRRRRCQEEGVEVESARVTATTTSRGRSRSCVSLQESLQRRQQGDKAGADASSATMSGGKSQTVYDDRSMTACPRRARRYTRRVDNWSVPARLKIRSDING